MSCGRDYHEHLEFGGGSTSAAAAYPERLCFALAGEYTRYLRTLDAHTRVATVGSGLVRRHVDRGPVALTPREVRAQEDLLCRAGCRNAFSVLERWPELAAVMTTVRDFLMEEKTTPSRVTELGWLLRKGAVSRTAVRTAFASLAFASW